MEVRNTHNLIDTDKYDAVIQKYNSFQRELSSSGLLNFSDTFFADFPLDNMSPELAEFVVENKNIRNTIARLNENLGKRIENLKRLNYSDTTFVGLPVSSEPVNLQEIYYDIDVAINKVDEAIQFVNDHLYVLQELHKKNKENEGKIESLELQVKQLSDELFKQQTQLDALLIENEQKDKELQHNLDSWLASSQKLDSLEKLIYEQELASTQVSDEKDQLIQALEDKLRKLVGDKKIDSSVYENIKNKDLYDLNFFDGIINLLHYFTCRYVTEILGKASSLEKLSLEHIPTVNHLLDNLRHINSFDFEKQYVGDLEKLVEHAQEDALLIPNSKYAQPLLKIQNTKDLSNYLLNDFSIQVSTPMNKISEIIEVFKNIQAIATDYSVVTIKNKTNDIYEILTNFINILDKYLQEVISSANLLNQNNFEIKDELLKDKYWIQSQDVLAKVFRLSNEWFLDFKRIEDYLKAVVGKDKEQQPVQELETISHEVKDLVYEELDDVQSEINQNPEFSLEVQNSVDEKILALRNYIDKLVVAYNEPIIEKINKLENLIKSVLNYRDSYGLENNNEKILNDKNVQKNILVEQNTNKNLKLRLVKSKLTKLKLLTEIYRNENYSEILDEIS